MSGQGDSNVEVGKDDDSEITSTTGNGGDSVSDLITTETVSGGVSVDADSTEATVASKDKADDSTEAVASNEKDPAVEQPPKGEDLSEAINDNVEADGAIDSNATVDATKTPSKVQVCGDTMTPSSKDEVTYLKSSKDTELCSSKDSNVEADKDSCSLSEDLELKWDEDDIDDTILTADARNQGIKSNKPEKTIDSDPKLIQEPDLVNDELDGNKSGIVESLDQLIEEISSDNKDDSKEEIIISSSIDENNQIDKEMASTSFESQDIIDKIDNITEDKEIDSGIPAEPIHLIETSIPDQGMDIDDSDITVEPINLIETTTIYPSIDNVTVEVETKLLLSPKEKEMEVDTVTEASLKTIDANNKDSEKSSGIEVIKETDITIASVDKTDDSEKCSDNSVTKDKDSEKSSEIEVVKEIDITIESGDKTDDSEKCNDTSTLNKDTDSEKSSEIEVVKETDIKEESGDKKDKQKCDDESILTKDSHDSDLGIITPNVHHRINKPNVMLDIPTNIELSDIEADVDDDDLDFKAKSVKKRDSIKTVENSHKTDVIDIHMQEEEKHDEIVLQKPVINTITSPTIEIDATSSKINIKTVSLTNKLLTNEELLTTKSSDESIKIELIDDKVPKAEVLNETNLTEVNEQSLPMTELLKSVKIESNDVELKPHIDVEKPTTSKAMLETLIPDNDSVQDVSDSLGLLAESSRVMDDDNDDEIEDADDQDGDDNDDEDFDPYEETNSDIAEDMDSRTPPPDIPKLEQLDKPGRDSDEDTLEIPSTMDIVDDIECVENDLPGLDNTVPGEDDVSIMKTDEVIDADLHIAKKGSPPDKIINILEKVLGPQTSTSVKGKDSTAASNVRNYVEVEGSSESDDESKSGKVLSECKTAASRLEELLQSVSEPESNVSVSKPDETIKTATVSTPLQVPETSGKIIDTLKRDEVFSLDSDDDDDKKVKKEVKPEEMETENETEVEGEVLKPESPKIEIQDESPKDPQEQPKSEKKCINPSCTSGTKTYYPVDRTTAAYYSLNRRRAFVCDPCRQTASERSEALIKGIKEFCPLIELNMDAPSQQLVEISDSDSDGEGGDNTERIGERGARFLEEHLADMINETWQKYKMESRLKNTETYILNELDKIEADAKEINAMLDECQTKTDKIRFDFYKDYEMRRKNLGAIVIHDTPFSSYSHTEKDVEHAEPSGSRYPKRRAASLASDTPYKKQALPMGSISLGGDKMAGDRWKTEDDKEDISVVKLSAEAAPADLPPPGEIVRPPLVSGMTILAMRNAFGTWLKGRIVDVQLKPAGQQFTQCRIKFEHKVKNPCKMLAGRCLAYPEPSKVRLTIGTRVVALFKDPHNTTRREALYGGVVAEVPNPVNSYRYLVFFDDGYAQYVHHQDTRIVCESSHLVWEEVHPFIRDFIYKYLLSYPERPMVRLHAGEKLKTEWNGKWWDSKVLKVDASIALIHFDEDNRTEWIYRGSTRLAPLYLELQAAKAGEGKGRSRLPRSKAQMRSNMPCVEYTRSDEQATTRVPTETQQQNEELRRQRAVAKKSTTPSVTPPTMTPGANLEGFSRVVYYTPKNAVKPYKMIPHTCTIDCRRTDLLTMKDLRTYNPLAKPLLSGWERQTVRYKTLREVVYRAPCGRRLRNMSELHKYLRIIQSDMSVDMFDFTPGTHCLAEFVLNKCNVSKKDLSHGKENVPVPCVNYYDSSLPEFCSYNTERTPTAGVPLNLDPEFLCGCDCTDDCQDKTKCACWKMTLEGARTIGLEGPNVGYVYRRLPEPLPSGIYECNSRCKCKQTCLNRVAQHPLQLKLQVFKTSNRGWGIRALNDVPKGSFLCVYAGNLLTDATANLDGLNEGDEYLAELDYIEVVEAMKEGYEDDVPDEDKKRDKKNSSESESEPSSESEDDTDRTGDGDFQPGYIEHPNVVFKKSLRKREKAKKKEEKKQEEAQNKKEETKKKDDCITISDDEEVREPSRFTAEDGMVDKDLITKHSSRVSVRTLFGKDEACYIMDAKVQGNIGRYLNHSCHPNVFVQNVFVDTHDPRFPWVAFFALSHVKAGTELTWNYNYDVGSVPEKVLYCYCGAPNCRGRLL